MDSDIDKVIDKLDKEVNQFSQPEADTSGKIIPKYNFSLPSLTSPIVYYIGIPILILIILLVWKPKFIRKDGSQKRDYRKALGWTIMFTACIALGIFAVKYRTK